jgi:hypothetical protein
MPISRRLAPETEATEALALQDALAFALHDALAFALHDALAFALHDALAFALHDALAFAEADADAEGMEAALTSVRRAKARAQSPMVTRWKSIADKGLCSGRWTL